MVIFFFVVVVIFPPSAESPTSIRSNDDDDDYGPSATRGILTDSEPVRSVIVFGRWSGGGAAPERAGIWRQAELWRFQDEREEEEQEATACRETITRAIDTQIGRASSSQSLKRA